MSTEDLVAELRRREESGGGRRKAPWKRRIIQAAVGAVCTAITAGGGYFVQQFFETVGNQEKVSVNQQAQTQAMWRAIAKLRDAQVATQRDVTRSKTDIEWIIRLAEMDGVSPVERPEIDEKAFSAPASVLELPIDQEDSEPPEPVADPLPGHLDPLLSSEPSPRVRKRIAKSYKPSEEELQAAQQAIQQLIQQELK
jgi:hypothetical protein